MGYIPITMIDPLPIRLTKAEQSLRAAESEHAQGRYNDAESRCYYACFQAAVAALHHAGLRPRRGRRDWGHAFRQAELVGRLIHRRRLYPVSLRQVLSRHLTLRLTTDHAPDLVTQTQAARACHGPMTSSQPFGTGARPWERNDLTLVPRACRQPLESSSG